MLRSPRRWSMFGLLTVGAVALVVVVVALLDGGERSRAHAHSAQSQHFVAQRIVAPPGTPVATVGAPLDAPRIQAGFVGLSFEFGAVTPYAGTDPNAVNPVLVQLIRDLSPGQSPVLRIGGDSTDWAWWPIPHMAKPSGIRITLSPRWLGVVRTLAQSLDARLIMGINMEADSARVARAEARAFVHGLGSQHIRALELGNEPELYGSFPWYLDHGVRVTGRPQGWDFQSYVQDFAYLSSDLPHVPVAGPAIGSNGWLAASGQFLTGVPRLQLLTLHRYPLQRCYMPAGSTMYPSVPHLFAADSSVGLADSVSGPVAAARARHVPVRIDEMNTVSCGGAPGISNTFAAALWSIGTLFDMARVGVSGVNFHTFPSAAYRVFSFTHRHGVWRGFVSPEYYGLMLFAQAAPPGSRLLRVSGDRPRGLGAWATRGREGWTRVVLVNESSRARYLTLRGAGIAGAGELQQLRAPRLEAQRGVTFAGQSFGNSTDTGLLSGTPTIISVAPVHGGYTVRLPAASAALVSFPPAARPAA